MKIKNRLWFCLLITLFILSFSCTKEKKVYFIMNPWIPYGSMTDQDGNTYKTILIGTQTWMAENLKTTRLNNGKSIPIITDATSWSNLSTPACCWQNNDPIRKVTYGVLYNWYTVNTGKLCPTGWHVPSDEEWTTLTDYVGGANVAGGKLKESGFKHWNSPNTEATNETAFSAFPGGVRLNDSVALFSNLREMGCFWTTESEDDQASTRLMYYNSNLIQRLFYHKNCGLSVRCVWDYY
jgi:uncharacterized protein (TIGR02145 family)